ncbi:adenosine 5'-monophosphoramidase HINT1-like isoform X2 [Oculina patagonica]
MAARGNSVFARIIRRELPATFLHEDDQCIAIEDINPQAPVHFLVIPKKEIRKLSDTSEEHEQLLGHCMIVARKVAAQKGVDQNGYRVIINNGQHGCQSVYHIHLHVMAGRPLRWPPE